MGTKSWFPSPVLHWKCRNCQVTACFPRSPNPSVPVTQIYFPQFLNCSLIHSCAYVHTEAYLSLKESQPYSTAFPNPHPIRSSAFIFSTCPTARHCTLLAHLSSFSKPPLWFLQNDITLTSLSELLWWLCRICWAIFLLLDLPSFHKWEWLPLFLLFSL